MTGSQGVAAVDIVTEAGPPTCAAASRWSFLCMIAPLRLPTGAGSRVNPIAIL
jgi:hypothetical protein